MARSMCMSRAARAALCVCLRLRGCLPRRRRRCLPAPPPPPLPPAAAAALALLFHRRRKQRRLLEADLALKGAVDEFIAVPLGGAGVSRAGCGRPGGAAGCLAAQGPSRGVQPRCCCCPLRPQAGCNPAPWPPSLRSCPPLAPPSPSRSTRCPRAARAAAAARGRPARPARGPPRERKEIMCWTTSAPRWACLCVAFLVAVWAAPCGSRRHVHEKHQQPDGSLTPQVLPHASPPWRADGERQQAHRQRRRDGQRRRRVGGAPCRQRRAGSGLGDFI